MQLYRETCPELVIVERSRFRRGNNLPYTKSFIVIDTRTLCRVSRVHWTLAGKVEFPRTELEQKRTFDILITNFGSKMGRTVIPNVPPRESTTT